MSHSLTVRVLALLLSLPLTACGDDAGSGGDGGGGGDGGSGTPDAMAEVDYCAAAGGGCMTVLVEGGVTYQACVQWISDGIPVPPEVETGCVDDGDTTRTWMPEGCPQDGNIMCGTIGGSPNVGGRLVIINFSYSTGDASIDSTYCTTCGPGTPCCEGPEFP